MSEVIYRAHVRVERLRGPLRRATLPAEDAPVFFGSHGAIAANYGHPPGEDGEHATTLDYVVAAAGG